MEAVTSFLTLRPHRKRVNYSEVHLDALLRDDGEAPPKKKAPLMTSKVIMAPNVPPKVRKSHHKVHGAPQKRMTIIAMRVNPSPLVASPAIGKPIASPLLEGVDVEEKVLETSLDLPTKPTEATVGRRGRKEKRIQEATPRTEFKSDEAYMQYMKQHQNRVNVQVCREKKRARDRVVEDKVEAMAETLIQLRTDLQAVLNYIKPA